jgi:hypothetical protein
VLISAPIFLYLDIEPCFTARTHHGVLSLFPRQAKVVFARGEFFVNVGFFVAYLTFLEIEKFLWFVCQYNEVFVFLLPFVNIS